MKALFLTLAAVGLSFCTAETSAAADLQVVASTRYVRVDGAPNNVVQQFDWPLGGPALLRVTNGSLEDSTVETVSSSIIKINGTLVFGPAEFNQNVHQLEKAILLAPGTNTLEVELRGRPGGEISCQIVQPVANVRVEPASVTLTARGATVQLAVLATLTDATTVDISATSAGTRYASASTAIATVSETGLVTAVAGGRTYVTVTAAGVPISVPVAVQGTAPTASNLQLAQASVPLPRAGESFTQALTFDFADPDADVERIDVTLVGPAGVVQTGSLDAATPEGGAAGSASHEFVVDSSYVEGSYEVQLEAIDSVGGSSGVQTIGFSVSTTASRLLDITGLDLLSGSPGDRVVIHGVGFAEAGAPPLTVRFEPSIEVEVLSVDATRIEVAVPLGAVSGPIVVETPAGRAVSPMPFDMPATMTIEPDGARLLTGETREFDVVQSGSRSATLQCTVNGSTTPGPELGVLALAPGGFVYTSPGEVPPGGRVSIRCQPEAGPDPHATVEVEIVVPPPPPGTATVDAASGGVVESVEGGTSLAVPAGALSSDTPITVERLNPDLVPWSWDGGYLLAAVRLGPSGLAFSQPATVTVPLTHPELPGSTLRLLTLDETTGSAVDTGAVASAVRPGHLLLLGFPVDLALQRRADGGLDASPRCCWRSGRQSLEHRELSGAGARPRQLRRQHGVVRLGRRWRVRERGNGPPRALRRRGRDGQQ